MAKNRIAKRKARLRTKAGTTHTVGCPPGQVACGSAQPGDPPVCCPAGEDPGFDISESYQSVRRVGRRRRR